MNPMCLLTQAMDSARLRGILLLSSLVATVAASAAEADLGLGLVSAKSPPSTAALPSKARCT